MKALWGRHLFLRARNTRRRGALLSFVLAILLVGCGEDYCTCPTYSKVLNLPGAQRMTALDSVLNYPNTTGAVEGIVSYTDPSGESMALISVEGRLHQTSLGENSSAWVQGSGCTGYPALSEDHRLVACASGTGRCTTVCGGSFLSIAPLSSLPDATWQTIADESDTIYNSPTWAPDGKHLAVLSNNSDFGCAIEIYTSANATYTLTGIIPVPTVQVFQNGPTQCATQQVTWSPDGSVLLLLMIQTNGEQTPTSHVAVLPLTMLPASMLAASNGTVIATAHPIPLAPAFDFHALLAWKPGSNTLTVAESRAVYQFDISTSTVTHLFSIPENGPYMTAFAWSVDGHSVLLAASYQDFLTAQTSSQYIAHVAIPNICVCPKPPPTLYTYPIA